jgi:type I restriction enzyme S subunit
MTVKPKSEVAVQWLGEILRAMNLGQYSQSAAQLGLSVEFVVNVKGPVPPLDE